MRRKKGMWQFNSYGGVKKDSKNRRRRSLADYTCGEPFKKLIKLQTIILLLLKKKLPSNNFIFQVRILFYKFYCILVDKEYFICKLCNQIKIINYLLPI